MLKLPKGLKKKKKGKKSKKDKELFTEEELEQYRREHQNQSALNSAAPSDSEDTPSQSGEKSSDNAEEWSKFAALTTGIDSVLRKTQEDLDRIKEKSFFQKVPTKVELEQKEREEQLKREEEERLRAEEAAREAAKEAEEKRAAEALINAVVELSDSEPNSEVEEDIFDTNYTDAIASGELPIAYVPESPELESFEGPDPFDTSYAEKVIKGPDVSKRGKKIVNIGAAVEVLTGRVETVTKTSSIRRPRRGPKNLLLESFDDGQEDEDLNKPVAEQVAAEPLFTLLDDPTDELPGDTGPIDLSVSLHLALQKEQETKKEEEPELDLDEFDDLKKRDSTANEEEFQLLTDPEASKKPSRPPPPRPAAKSHLAELIGEDDDDDFNPNGDDPFDTGFVERVLPATAKEDDDFDPRAEEGLPTAADEDDFDFDPRAGEEPLVEKPNRAKTPDLFSSEENTAGLLVQEPLAKDLLSGSTTDLNELAQTPLEFLAPGADSVGFVDPFDTSAVDSIVAPGKTELKFLEEELLTNNAPNLSHSLSDPDFDPRAGCEQSIEVETKPDTTVIAQRKSSLSLQINGSAARNKTVVFAVPTPDLLKIDGDNTVSKKPLTPYYSRESSIPESESVDPFDTSFVPSIGPTSLELNLIEQELNSVSLKHSLSDPDFDPRASSPVAVADKQSVKSDLLGISEEYNQKVLTPAKQVQPEEIDPFDTSIAIDIKPGRAELKLLEDELIPASTSTDNQDILSNSQDASAVFVKVLTPQASKSIDVEDIDPFDTSFANDLGPGKTEIKLLESELID
ncbi:protein stoned-A [Uranotaenia lowii]|uniref:protein stoned-A n=1 Tax=Uranotaenia lowii TaxID=190385 RepID=UPI00247A83CE|nr:protein stoned-A [Uranotaenia lowii]